MPLLLLIKHRRWNSRWQLSLLLQLLLLFCYVTLILEYFPSRLFIWVLGLRYLRSAMVSLARLGGAFWFPFVLLFYPYPVGLPGRNTATIHCDAVCLFAILITLIPCRYCWLFCRCLYISVNSNCLPVNPCFEGDGGVRHWGWR